MSYADDAENRIYIWERQAPKLVSFIRHIPELLDENFSKACSILGGILDYSQSSGEMLNIVGRIVGIHKRPAIRTDSLGYFGYFGNPLSQPYDTSPYYDGDATPSTILVNDSTFRGIIAAKIFRNTSAHTIEDYKVMIDTIFGVNCTIVDNKNSSFSIELNADQIDRMLFAAANNLGIIQPPMGIELTSISN